MSFEKRVEERLAAQDAAALVAMANEAANKKERKAVKRALYLLEQRGVSIPRKVESASRAPGASIASASLPVLMAPPGPNDFRRFTFAVPDGAKLTIVECRFGTPDGLLLVEGSPSTRAEYLPWAQGMCRRPKRGLPERVRLDAAILPRKLGEMRTCMQAGRIGADVDEALVWRILTGKGDARHPVLEATPKAEPLAMRELAQEPWRLDCFRHEGPLSEIRQKLSYDSRALHGVDSPVPRWADEWAQEWGADRVKETLLDLAAFATALGDHGAASAYLHATEDPAGFIVEFASWELLQR